MEAECGRDCSVPARSPCTSRTTRIVNCSNALVKRTHVKLKVCRGNGLRFKPKSPEDRDISIRSFFLMNSIDRNDFDDEFGAPHFQRATARLGTLPEDEMHGFEPALEAWIGDTPFMERDAYYVIARSAFGELFLWGEKTGQSLTIRSLWGMMFPKDDSDEVAAGRANALIRSFIAFKKKKDLDQKDDLDKPLFERALNGLGPLASDEMYAFEPALAIGGVAQLKNLRKVKAVEHLVILAQLGERQVMRDIVKDAKAAGLL